MRRMVHLGQPGVTMAVFEDDSLVTYNQAGSQFLIVTETDARSRPLSPWERLRGVTVADRLSKLEKKFGPIKEYKTINP